MLAVDAAACITIGLDYQSLLLYQCQG